VQLKESPVGGVAAVAGLGRVVHHERLPDGRFHILLQGLARVELVEELPMGDLLYRRVRARKLSSRDEDTLRIGRELSTLKSCYARLTESMPASKDTLGDLPLRLDDPCVVGDVVCAAALDDVALRQQALEEIDVGARLSLANEALATLLLKSLACEESGMH
jgi:Lon protease-like protein